MLVSATYVVSFTSAYLCLFVVEICQAELPRHSETNPRHLQDAIDVGHLDYISYLSTITLIMDKQSQQYPYVERPMPAHYSLRKATTIVSTKLTVYSRQIRPTTTVHPDAPTPILQPGIPKPAADGLRSAGSTTAIKK